MLKNIDNFEEVASAFQTLVWSLTVKGFELDVEPCEFGMKGKVDIVLRHKESGTTRYLNHPIDQDAIAKAVNG